MMSPADLAAIGWAMMVVGFAGAIWPRFGSFVLALVGLAFLAIAMQRDPLLVPAWWPF